jgi:S1-C subfamily serine protease
LVFLLLVHRWEKPSQKNIIGQLITGRRIMGIVNSFKMRRANKVNFIKVLEEAANKKRIEQELEHNRLQCLLGGLGKFASYQSQINAGKILSLYKLLKEELTCDDAQFDDLFSTFDNAMVDSQDLLTYASEYKQIVDNDFEKKADLIYYLMFIAYWDKNIDNTEEAAIREVIKVLSLPYTAYDSTLFRVKMLKNIASMKIKEYGSGYFITNDGYAITCHHVVAKGNNVKIRTHDNLYDAKKIISDKNSDLCLLKIDADTVPVRIDDKPAKIRREIMVYGFPQPEFQGYSPKITKGIISSDNGPRDNCRNMQIDASVQPGNSGGPVIDLKTGYVIGTVTSAMKKGQNVNFAVKNEELLNFLSMVPGIDSLVNFERYKTKEEASTLKHALCQIFVCK